MMTGSIPAPITHGRQGARRAPFALLTPEVLATVLALKGEAQRLTYLHFLVYSRGGHGGFEFDYRALAATLGLTGRAVKGAVRALRKRGLVVAERSRQEKVNPGAPFSRKGESRFTLGERKGESSFTFPDPQNDPQTTKPQPDKRRGTDPALRHAPEEKKEKHACKHARSRAVSEGKRTGALHDLTTDELRDDQALKRRFKGAVAAGLINGSEASRLTFWVAATQALTGTNPPGLFIHLLRHPDELTDAAEDEALERLRALAEGTDSRAIEEPEEPTPDGPLTLEVLTRAGYSEAQYQEYLKAFDEGRATDWIRSAQKEGLQHAQH